MITDTAVGPANAGDGAMTDQLTRDLDPDTASDTVDDHTDESAVDSEDNGTHGVASGPVDDGRDATDGEDTDCEDGERPAIYGDAAYGSGANLANLERRGIVANTKVQPPASRGGLFTKDAFAIDLEADTVTCPGGHTVAIGRNTDGDGVARFGVLCLTCPLRDRCTTAKAGRAVTVSRYERLLAAARTRQADPAWRDDYRATRPKVERKLAHMLRAGRRARRRGRSKVDADWNYTGAGVNYARLARLGLRTVAGSWQIATT